MDLERPVTVEDIRGRLEDSVGKTVYVKANKGRKRFLETKGVIVETYPKLFVLKLDHSNAVRRRSYTYADVLTKNVQITIDDEKVV